MHTLSSPILVILLFLSSIQAWIIPFPNPIHPRQLSDTMSPPPVGWSKEAIFALLGVCATLITCVIGLAWPRLRPRLIGVRRTGTHPLSYKH